MLEFVDNDLTYFKLKWEKDSFLHLTIFIAFCTSVFIDSLRFYMLLL